VVNSVGGIDVLHEYVLAMSAGGGAAGCATGRLGVFLLRERGTDCRHSWRLATFLAGARFVARFLAGKCDSFWLRIGYSYSDLWVKTGDSWLGMTLLCTVLLRHIRILSSERAISFAVSE
jgi:hypothetical protein